MGLGVGGGASWGWAENTSSGMCLPSKSGSHLAELSPRKAVLKAQANSRAVTAWTVIWCPSSLGQRKPVSSPATRQAAFGLGSDSLHLGSWS